MSETAESDAVWGAAGIAKVLNVTPRKAHYLLTNEVLTEAGARMVRGRWMASRRRLKAFIEGEREPALSTAKT